MRKLSHRFLFRAAAMLLIPGQAVFPIPVSATPASGQETQPARSAPSAASRPAPGGLTFSATPTDLEITGSGLFEEPLVPVGAPTTEDNRALVGTLRSYAPNSAVGGLGTLERFLASHGQSPWRPALLTNLGLAYQRSGYLSKALSAWESAWAASKDDPTPQVKALANRALSELARLDGQLGRALHLEGLLKEAGGRPVGGSAGATLEQARAALQLIKTRPEQAFRCGPQALDRLLAAYQRPGQTQTPLICTTPATSQGTNLSQLEAASRAAELDLQAAKRGGKGEIPVPSVMHWKLDHFSPVVDTDSGRYLIDDPALGGSRWVSRAAIDGEGSGYFLIQRGELPKGWRSVPESEGREVWGRGYPDNQNPSISQNSTKLPPQTCPPGPPMAEATAHLMYVNLSVSDTPLRYAPAVGPTVNFQVTYNHRDGFQPATPDYPNLGPLWTFDWMSWVKEEDSTPNPKVSVYIRGAGEETYGWGSGGYPPNYESGARVGKVGTYWERTLPDGSRELFEHQRGSKFYLTKIMDAQGNTVEFVYSTVAEGAKLDKVRDTLGQETILSYDLPGDVLKVTRVTDPFGRFAKLDYAQQDGRWRLARITDAVGIVSEFSYDSSDFMSSLTTPYGTSRFAYGTGVSGPTQWLDLTDPTGGTRRVEYYKPHTATTLGLPNLRPSPEVPTDFDYYNVSMDAALSVIWDERAMAQIQATGQKDYSKAHLIVWAWAGNPEATTSLKRLEKLPLENPVWYVYPGQGSQLYPAEIPWDQYAAGPAKVGRVLDDGTSQITQYEYNAKGKVIRAIDPVVRETVYVYGNNNIPDDPPATGQGIDLLEVKQKNASGLFDTLARYTYNAAHQVQSATDAAGKITAYAYDSRGRLLTVITPGRDSLTEAQRTTTYTYHPDTGVPSGTAGRVQKVTGPTVPGGAPATSYQYDSYGRPWKVTDQEGYTITTDYDAIDRPLRVTYPDGTYEQTVYNRLDGERHRDRLGRWSQTLHDALRRVVSIQDALGRTTTQQWCGCGSMDQLVDANGNTTHWERDIQGRVTKEVRANESSTLYTYETTTSRLWKVQDAKGQLKTHSYFLDDNLQSITYQNAVVPTPSVSFTYDPAYNRVLSMTDGTGTSQYGYHPAGVLGAGRLASVDGPLADDTITYGYDELGRAKTRQVNGTANSTGFLFDPLGRLTTETNPLGAFTFAYQGATGRLGSLTYPNAQQSAYSYFGNSGDQRLQEIHHKRPDGSTLSKFNYTYDAVGNIKTWAQQRDSDPTKVWEYGYDLADQLSQARITAPTPLPTPNRYSYAYDPAANRTVEQIDDTPALFKYDNMNRLTDQAVGGSVLFKGTVSEPAQVTIAPGTPAIVDAANRFEGRGQATVVNNAMDVTITATDYASPTPNTRTNTYRVPVTGTPRNFTYDPNGNLTGDGTKTYEWDAENRLTAVKQGAATLATFSYGGSGYRATKTAAGVTHTYVYDAEDIVEERLNSGGTIKYFHGPGIDQPFAKQDASGAVSYYVADHLGSIARITNAAGAPVLNRTYDAWGNLSEGYDSAGYAYTAREWDPEIGLHYYRARYYDPKIGRFISEDPIGFDGGDNFYAYVGENPVNRRDPFGVSPGDPNVQDRPCGMEAYSWCTALCGPRGVKSCKETWVYQIVRKTPSGPTGQGVSIGWDWVKTGAPKCECNEPKPPVCGENCVKVLIFVAVLGRIIWICVTRLPAPI